MKLRSWAVALLVGIGLLASLVPVSAQETHKTPGSYDNDVFAFGGRFHDNYFQYGFVPFLATYEDNYLLGVGYQHFFLHLPNDFNFGTEIGIDGRFGNSPASAEVWAGVVGRYDGWNIGDLHVAPAVTFGFSAETGAVGIEKAREVAAVDGNSRLLFFIGPELNFSTVQNPNVEAFWRIQHRSGAWGTLGDIGDSANATTLGVRFHF